MKERGILFQRPMVCALLAGTKMQTRRVVKPAPPPECSIHYMLGNQSWLPKEKRAPLFHHWEAWGGPLFENRPKGHLAGSHSVTSPYGQPGDRLWVREAFRTYAAYDAESMGDMQARLSCSDDEMTRVAPIQYVADDERRNWYADAVVPGRYRHARFMPRWASRILLEITDVRVERLQAISEADASAEGCDRLRDDEPGYVDHEEPDWKLCPQCGGTRLYTSYGANLGACFDTDCTRCDTYVKRYRWLWESINGEGSWDANPWVWAVDFKRITP